MGKSIRVFDTDLTITGRLGDPYFDHLNIGDHTNDFLLYVGKNHVSNDATIFDVGANIGVTSAILATAAPRGRLFAFEPGAETYPHLLTTIEANKITNCHPQQIAFGAMSGEVDFFANTTSGAASHIAFDGTTLVG